MSQRNLITGAVFCIALAAGGLVFIQLNDSGNRELPQSDQPPESSRSTNYSEYSSQRTPRLARERNRFEGITDKSVRWQVRVDQLRRLDASTLNPVEVDYLYSLLKQHPQGHSNEDWWVVVNEVMEQIIKQAIAQERIEDEFSALISDAALHSVVRDYAVQHLSNYLKSTKKSHDVTDSLNTLVDVIQDPSNQNNTIPGTALMGLVEIASNPVFKEQINSSFVQLQAFLTPLIKGETPAMLANRTSAINAVGLLQAEHYHPLLRELILADDANASVKLSSVAALGDFHRSELGEEHQGFTHLVEQDRELLRDLASGHTKFKYAASAALKKLQ